MFRMILSATCIAFITSSYSFASDNDDQLSQNCEYSIPDDLIIGSNEYWEAVDKCVEEMSTNAAIATEDPENKE
jgi:hypothetical protein